MVDVDIELSCDAFVSFLPQCWRIRWFGPRTETFFRAGFGLTASSTFTIYVNSGQVKL